MFKSKVLNLLLMLALALSLLVGCGQNEQPSAEQAKDTAAPEQSIKIGGSSTLAPVIAQLANEYTEEYGTWNKVDASLPEEPIVIFVSTGGSGFGVKSAINGTFDIGLVSRSIKDEEKEQIPNGQLIKVGTDALAIAVNPENPVLQVKPNLTTEELKGIFAGEIKTWKELDPQLPDRQIVLAIRDLGGGASEVFDTTVMQGTPVAKEAIQLPSMGALAGKVMENVDAIGYVSTGFVDQNQGKIAVLSIDGVEPTDENIASDQYKISRPLIMVTKDQPTAQQQKFIDFVMSAEGLAVVKEMGFVPAK
ncbi:phosphate ABC transporter substrate-binding protein [Peptococcaceae bacterium 1198_IL3148]